VKVRGTFRRGLLAGLLGCATLAVVAPAANASDSWNSTSFDFGSRQVGTTSAPQAFALVATCDLGLPPPNPPLCTLPGGGAHNYGAITTTGPGFAIVPDTDVCNARNGLLITPVVGIVDVCTLEVTFKPTSAGTKTGTLTTTTSPSGNPISVALRGTGVAPLNGQGTTATPKKCKKKGKKRSASAAKKKCKKKKR
jgi:hypothetical protein